MAQRPDAIVDVNCGDAIFVEVIPRRNWKQITLQNAEDVGLLRIDREQRQVLFEGDIKRYRIPAEAIVASDMELMNKNDANDPRSISVGIVVLTVRDRLGERELPLRPVRTVSGDPLGSNYVARAHELQRRILEVCSLAAEARTPATV